MLLHLLAACFSNTPQPTALADAPTSRAWAMRIEDGAPSFEHLGVHERKCTTKMDVHKKGGSGCAEGTFRLTPIRAPGQPLEPVKAWVHCAEKLASTDEACRALLMERPVVEGRVLWRFSEGTTGWNKAIDASGLQSMKRAPIIIVE